MKIVCGSCGAKYSIADEKVQGKVFKIRCRKCSNVIVVKGSADGSSVEHLSAAEAESASADFGGGANAAEWYVVIDGDQSGPMTPDEIEAQVASGRITPDCFVWRDGMGDWSLLKDVDIFQHLAQSREEEATHVVESPVRAMAPRSGAVDDDPTAAVDPGAVRAAMESNSLYDSFGGYGSAEPAPAAGGFAASFGGGLGMNTYDEPSSNDGLFASLDQGSSDKGGLAYQSFAGIGSSSSLGGLSSGGEAAVANVRTSDAPSLSSSSKGAPELISTRNENSVLFSLSSLQKVEAIKADSKPDVPLTDGSGLIDLQGLASTHQALKSGSKDEPSIDVFAAGSMSSMPAIMPRGTHRNNTPLLVGGGIVIVLLLGAVVGIGYKVFTMEPSEKEVIREKEIVIKEVVKDTSAADKAAEEADRKAKEALAAAANKPDDEDDDGPEDPKKPRTKRPPRTNTTTNNTGSTNTVAKPAETTSKPSSKPKEDGIDALLKKVDEKPATNTNTPKKVAPPPKEEPKVAVQEKLSRSDVQNTIAKYTTRVDSCANSSNKGSLKGTMFLKMLVKPDGSVSNVEVDTPNFKGTDVGDCVAKVAQSMKFPASEAGIPSLRYPFILK
jgi:predicted Zn finger-like uncharacterized protein